MKLLSHTITDFRNIREMSLNFDGGVTVISGENGHGKTNVLESIWMLTGAKSFRTNDDAALVREGCEFSRIQSDYNAEGRGQTLKLTIGDGGRLISRNESTPAKASTHAGAFLCVVFSPDSLEIVKGSPEKRRRFIDTALCLLYPSYLSALKSYNRLVAQKNSLLKDCRYVSAAYDMLDVFDMSLAKYAALVCLQRRDFVQKLAPICARYYSMISEHREELSVEYRPTLFEDGEIFADAAAAAIARSRADDLKYGFCSKGPHRDDLSISLFSRDMRSYSSQGQKRSAVLALKLAEADLYKQASAESSIMLLDDVLSELDEKRQNFLVGCMGDYQTIITACDPHAVAGKTDCKIYKINEGALVE